ncbi:MAG: oligosaccharide flippase family protein [Gemmatimonadaceae bacterium]|nr:oligosaccharide flippase family protein [Gemmatimonadaceae bacterium]
MSGQRLAANAVWNLLPFGLGFILNLAAVSLVVGWIGVDDFGLFGLLAVVLAPLTLANLGFGEATVKFVAEAAHAGDLETAGRYVRTTLAMNLLVGVAGALLLAFILPPLALRVFSLPAQELPRVTGVLRAIALSWLSNQAAAVFLAVPPAFQRFRLAALGHAITLTLLAGGGVLGAYIGGLVGYAFGTAGGAAAGVVVWRTLARRLLPAVSLWPAFDRGAWHRSLRFGGWQAVAQLGTLAASQAERFLLGVFLSPGAVGYYNIAQGFEQRMYSAVYKMSEVLFPHFSTLSDVDPARKSGLLLRASWLLTSLAVCALAPLIPLAAPLLVTWISPEAGAQAAPVMQALAIAGILGCASNASFFFLLGMGDTRGLALLSGVTGIVTIVVALLVLPRWGLPVAGVAAAAAMIAQQLCLSAVLLPRRLGAALRPGALMAALYAPVVAGLAVAALAFAAGASAVRGWPAVIGGYAAVGLLTAIAIGAISEVMPGRDERRRDIGTVLRFLRPRTEGAG